MERVEYNIKTFTGKETLTIELPFLQVCIICLYILSWVVFSFYDYSNTFDGCMHERYTTCILPFLKSDLKRKQAIAGVSNRKQEIISCRTAWINLFTSFIRSSLMFTHYNLLNILAEQINEPNLSKQNH